MLTSIRLCDFRSFGDTDVVDLKKLNIFIGPNNAGKSAFLNAVELILRSAQSRPDNEPLRFTDMPQFASFDSVVRRHWSSAEARAKQFRVIFDLTIGKRALHAGFECRGDAADNKSYVQNATYSVAKPGIETTEIVLNRESRGTDAASYAIKYGTTQVPANQTFFVGLVPFGVRHTRGDDLAELLTLAGEAAAAKVEVVNPYRPIPRSFYVLDDPALSVEDRALVSFLIEAWKSERKGLAAVRQRVLENLSTLALVKHFEVKQVGKARGPKIVEIKVAPQSKRQAVTIADVGFGVSQVLPLAVCEARLSNGYLVAYQPELHLHPFAQSRLADIFVQSLSRKNQVFVETHSVDLILRLQALIANGTVSADDVQVICLENQGGLSHLSKMVFDSAGRPTSKWPEGFLDTSLKLARDLAARRVQA